MSDYKFEGWVGVDKSAADGKMVWKEFQPKAWEETDVDIKVTHCGVCGSDIHTLRSDRTQGPTDYPCVVGHEIVGRAVRVGSQVKHVAVGDRVGVGAQSDSCRNRKGPCEECSAGLENHCRNGTTDTYNSKHQNGDKSYGGYATYSRVPGHFVFKIPDGLRSADVAPMLCGGITTYAPLKRNGCGPGKAVGVVGVGGLGHFAILWAKALGASKIVGISRKKAKEQDSLALGADAYIATDDDPSWVRANFRTLDLIICTVSSNNMPLKKYLRLLRTGGKFVQVGAPEGNMPAIGAFDLLGAGIYLGGSSIGSPGEIREMLQLAADKNVKAWVEERKMADANQVVVDMEDGKARYRYALVNEDDRPRL
ncbi:putative zinc-binding alcohol dehydrogenase [Eremomyces bilateralis CBS 781.70]|uniref:alcohol dehydrogenase (NADP(+)) n=1 Tax=Eremomyces bilateralis CBS 781.70 TaxID=1392243 RepID=A0A6G1GBH1_9PEZI|nr:putative zinc-binding alcohol dehydrogenase [Eremomyces bilateralis CBS 781.70]KAF1815199.1 putative zinc-binding alcohol dehydrogenase [Eremomyces bilateralis CBS 781.70]